MIWTIGGGKGGSGKSLSRRTLESVFQTGHPVVLIDADLEAISTRFLISPPALSFPISLKRVSHLEVLIPTAVPNLQL
jgi:MinD superfamily P-loop ATPase